jgi:hypothetical protein
MLVSSKRLQFISAGMAVFEDSAITLTVIPGAKVVYEGEPNPRTFDARKLASFNLIRDSLLSAGRITECREGASGLKEIVLTLDERGARRFGMTRIEFLIDAKHALIKRMYVVNAPTFQVSSVEYLFERIEYDKGTPATARSSVFADNGKLLSKYAGYRVVDNRKHRNQ